MIAFGTRRGFSKKVLLVMLHPGQCPSKKRKNVKNLEKKNEKSKNSNECKFSNKVKIQKF